MINTLNRSIIRTFVFRMFIILSLFCVISSIQVQAGAKGKIQFSSATGTYTVAEGAGSATITVVRTNGAQNSNAASVDYTTSNGTATAGADYTTSSGTITWAAGDISDKTFTVPITDDALVEVDETINLTLSNVTGIDMQDGVPLTAVLTITDNDVAVTPGTVEFSNTPFIVAENVGTGTVTITVSRVNGSDGAISVDYATSAGGSATAGADYTAVSGTLSWTAGDNTDQTFDVPILDDVDIEGDETVNLTLSNPTGTTISGGSEILTITDDDVAPTPGTVEFSNIPFIVAENVGTGTVTITVSRVNGSDGAISVDYATSAGGSATAGADYTAVSGTLSWIAGDNTDQTFDVPIIDDGDVEGDETVNLTLSNPTGTTISGGSEILTITDDDVAPTPGTLQFSSATYSESEGAGTATITVERVGGTSGAVQVTYATSDGTATQPADYATATGQLSWGDGVGGTQSFTVTIVDDVDVEGNETVNLELSLPTNGASIPETPTAILTITDNDAANTAPVAAPERYRISGTSPTFTVSAPGILLNDSDVDGDALSVVSPGSITLLGDTKPGSGLVVNADGSFTYTLGTGFVGDATFTYQAKDPSTATSNTVTVTLSVVGPHGNYSCTQCHGLHGGSTKFLARGADQEVLCKSCHNPTSNGGGDAETMAEVGTYADHGGLVDNDLECGACHDPHNYMDSNNPHTGGTLAKNIKYIRSDPKKYVAGAVEPLVFQDTPSRYAFNETDGAATDGKYHGACQACHTLTGHGKNDGSDLSDDHVNTNPDCMSCHTHAGSFEPPDGGGTCLTCHSSAKGTTRRIVYGSSGDFGADNTVVSHHVSSSSGVDGVTVADCEVCHYQTGHMNKAVKLKDVDSGTGALLVTLGDDADPDSDQAEADTMEVFCLRCHDSNGAAAGSLSDGATPPNIDTGWNVGADDNEPKRHGHAKNLSCYRGSDDGGCHSNGHGSKKKMLLGPFGTAATAPSYTEEEEGFCFNCHNAALATSTGNPDMDMGAKFPTSVTWAQANNTKLNDRHDVQHSAQLISGATIECADCHDVHAAKIQDGTEYHPLKGNPDPGPDGHDPTNPATDYMTWPAGERDFMTEWCLDCHDGSFPAGVNASNLSTADLKSTYLTSYHGGAASTGQQDLRTGGGAWGTNVVLPCLSCHAPHRQTKGNLFQLRDNPLDKNGAPLQYEGSDDFSMTTDTVKVPATNGWRWCNTCHFQSMGDAKAQCSTKHAHGAMF